MKVFDVHETFVIRSEKSFDFDHTTYTFPTNVNTHIHNCYELYYFLSGDLTYYIEGQAHTLEAHDMIVTNTRELHRIMFHSDAVYERKYIHFKSDFISAYQTEEYNLLHYIENRKLGQHNKIAAKDVKAAGIDQLWLDIENHHQNKNRESLLLTKTYFVQMLIALNKIYAKYDATSLDRYRYDEKTIQLLDYINHNLSERITLDGLEKAFFVNKYYLSHTFKRITGFTVIEYVTYKRIIWAIDMLMGGRPALEVSHATGFNDYSTFYKAFKKVTGVSPRIYMG